MASPSGTSRTLAIQHALRSCLLEQCHADDPADVVTAIGCELAEWLAHTVTDATTTDQLLASLRAYIEQLRALAPTPD